MSILLTDKQARQKKAFKKKSYPINSKPYNTISLRLYIQNPRNAMVPVGTVDALLTAPDGSLEALGCWFLGVGFIGFTGFRVQGSGFRA